ncbi:MAG: hypothetical protein LIO77_11180 [Rikenellaceae bacterium]|nr:hypothetical protein [Rikenellaceae bacterium]
MQIGEKIKFLLSVVAWCAIAAYLVMAVRMCRAQEESLRLTSTRIVVSDRSSIPIVDRQTVLDWLWEYTPLRDSMPLGELDTEKLREYIEARPMVKRAAVYTDLNGRLTVEVWPRRPVARFCLRNGYDFYLSEDNTIMPASLGGAVDVPLVTGSFPLPFERGYYGPMEGGVEENSNFSGQNYLYFSKLINFVRLVGGSTFWDSQIVQINVEAGPAGRWKEPEIELIPRVGRHVIRLGNLDDTQEKLDKLMLFYNRALDYEGWEEYRTIDLRYKDQIVCRRR